MRARALRYGTECTLSYLDLLEHVLVVSGAWAGPGKSSFRSRAPFPRADPLERGSGSTGEAGMGLRGRVSCIALPSTRCRCRLGGAAVRIQKSPALPLHQRGKTSMEEGGRRVGQAEPPLIKGQEVPFGRLQSIPRGQSHTSHSDKLEKKSPVLQVTY